MHIDKYTMIINEKKYDHNKKKEVTSPNKGRGGSMYLL